MHENQQQIEPTSRNAAACAYYVRAAAAATTTALCMNARCSFVNNYVSVIIIGVHARRTGTGTGTDTARHGTAHDDEDDVYKMRSSRLPMPLPVCPSVHLVPRMWRSLTGHAATNASSKRGRHKRHRKPPPGHLHTGAMNFQNVEKKKKQCIPNATSSVDV